jgi:hypothetical protein
VSGIGAPPHSAIDFDQVPSPIPEHRISFRARIAIRDKTSGLSPVTHQSEKGRSGHTFPFIARQTRACLNFEVKDGTKCRRQSKSDLSDFDIFNADLGNSRERFGP